MTSKRCTDVVFIDRSEYYHSSTAYGPFHIHLRVWAYAHFGGRYCECEM